MSLIAATVGAGTLAFPYAIMQNGIAFGGLLIFLGALISYYSGMLLVEASNYTGRHRYDEMARLIHGKGFSKLTSFCNLVCLLGFAMSFIVYQKESLPLILMSFVHPDKLPYWVKDNFWGECFWGTVYTFVLVFPISLPRKIGTLNYVSFIGVVCTFYVSIVVTVIFFFNRSVVPDPWDNIKNAKYFVFTFHGVAECVPMILFAYMYQVNIPMIYAELERREHKVMGKVVWRGSLAGVFLYASVGIFGYLTFYNRPQELLKQNILLADYGLNWAIIVGQVTSFFSVYFAMPFLYLPSKETVEVLIMNKKRMTMKQNVLCTIVLI
jgi:amino acid permease